jgi:hypothetical protein
MAGYSGKPLVQKLGVKPATRLALWDAPEGFEAELGPLPAGVRRLPAGEGPVECVLLFADRAAALAKAFPRAARTLTEAGMLWAAWPKKASGVATDLTEDVVRRVGLAAGLVDVKVCAVNDVWSGLKFVRRLKDRPGGKPTKRAP